MPIIVSQSVLLNTMKLLLLIFVMVSVVINAFAATPKKRGEVKQTHINIETLMDSALILVDDYARALSETPEISPSRLNMFKSYFAAKPKIAQDTICNSIFSFFIQYVEDDKAERATAFKNCYEAIASADDPNRGPLYAMEIQNAIVSNDTIKINEYLPLLEDYANRMNFDYNEEIVAAHKCLKSIRERLPINEAFAGIWVSEDIVGIINDGRYWQSPKDFDYHYCTTSIIQIRNRENPIYQGDKSAFVFFDKWKYNTDGINSKIDVFKGRPGWFNNSYKYEAIEEWEIPAFSYEYADSIEKYKELEHKSLSYIDKTMDDKIKKHLASEVIDDPLSQSIYVFWGDEKLRRNNAGISGSFRQLTQNMQSFVAGKLSRSHYSTADRVLGNLTSTLVSGAIDNLITNLSVSTDKIWSVEMTLKMINNRHLIADIYSQVIVSKSNEEQPKVYEYNRKVNYYRWEPSDSVGFINVTVPTGDLSHPDEYIFHHKISKENRNKNIALYKDYKKRFNDWKKVELKKMKAEKAQYPKESKEFKDLNERIKSFVKDRDAGGYACHEVYFNTEYLRKIKDKAENYQP